MARRDMLEKLDYIDWSELHHAYGTAEDVPDQLRALINERPGLNQGALWELFGNIWHQGTVYEATAYAVPFLIELAGNRSTPNRLGILHLLSVIAQGRSPQWAAKVHAAVRSGAGLLFSMTEDPGGVALATTNVLARLPECRERIRPRIRELFTHSTEPITRAGLLLLMQETNDRTDYAVAMMRQSLSRSEVERHAAALTIATVFGTESPIWAEDAIVEALLVADVEEEFVGLPWDAGGIDRARIITRLREPVRARVVDSLIGTLLGESPRDAQVCALLDTLFGTQFHQGCVIAASQLTVEQRRAVRAFANILARKERVFYGMFEQWGLPSNADAMRNLGD